MRHSLYVFFSGLATALLFASSFRRETKSPFSVTDHALASIAAALIAISLRLP